MERGVGDSGDGGVLEAGKVMMGVLCRRRSGRKVGEERMEVEDVVGVPQARVGEILLVVVVHNPSGNVERLVCHGDEDGASGEVVVGVEVAVVTGVREEQGDSKCGRMWYKREGA